MRVQELESPVRQASRMAAQLPHTHCTPATPAALPPPHAQVARQLGAAGWVPQVIVCSNAQRTRQTLDVMQQVLPELAEADAHFLVGGGCPGQLPPPTTAPSCGAHMRTYGQ